MLSNGHKDEARYWTFSARVIDGRCATAGRFRKEREAWFWAAGGLCDDVRALSAPSEWCEGVLKRSSAAGAIFGLVPWEPFRFAP